MNQESFEWLKDRIAAAQRVDVPQVIDGRIGQVGYWPMIPVRQQWDRGAAVMVQYDKRHDMQDAFNIVASLLPEHVRLKPTQGEGPDWVHIPPSERISEPLAQYGYIGWRWERPLEPGEYIARARMNTDKGSVTYVDVVVTAETLPVLRASGKYAEISTPRGL